jgi:hypothetical protein
MQTTAGDPADARMAGPRNPVLESQFPNVITAPATDISTQPFFWSSFNISPRRQQAGGWAREVTQADFAISGVNMYLDPDGIRELHWHQTGEWAIMTEGKCRVTTLSREGKPTFPCTASGSSPVTNRAISRRTRSRPASNGAGRSCTGTRTPTSGSTTCKVRPDDGVQHRRR